MNKKKTIVISIFVVTFLIGLTAILITSALTSPKNTPNPTNQQNHSAVPTLVTNSLVCSNTTSNKSLTVLWTLPAGLSSTDVIKGEISDSSTQSPPIQFGPLPITQLSYVFDQANGVDTYFASIWIEDASGNKGTVVTTNQINSSLCTSGSQPTPPAATSTTSPTPTATSTPTPTPSVGLKITSTPTPTTVQSANLACNTFTLTQNGAALTSTNVAVGSSAVTITPGITSPTSGTISYANAQWSITPSTPALTTGTGTASWTPPSDTSNGSTYTISLSGVTDSNGGTLASACTVVINLVSSGSTLPNTAGIAPTIAALIIGGLSFLIGMFLFFKKEL